MKIKKMLAVIFIWAMVFLPGIALADTSWSGGVGYEDEDISIGVGVGSGSGSGWLSGGDYGLPGGSVLQIIEGILLWLLAILSIVSLIGFIISGILYLTAAGDDTQIGRAKKAMMYSIVGVVVGLSGFVVYQAVLYMLSGSTSF